MHFFYTLIRKKVYAHILYKCRILSNFEGRKEVDSKELTAKIYIKLDLSRFVYKCLYQLFNFIYILIKVPNPDK